MKNNPLVSINIPTLNSGKTLENTLMSVKNQTYSNLEIVVADGGSKDGTTRIARKYNAKVCYGKELSKARFEAVKNSNGKFVLLLDSDQFIPKDLIYRCVKLVKTKNLNALVINEKSVIRKGRFIEKLLAYDKWVVNNSRDINPIFGAQVPRFFKKNILLNSEWPKDISILDDAIFFQKNLNFLKVGFLNGEGIMHYEIDSFKIFFKKFMRYGMLYLPTIRVSPETTIAHSLPRRAYFNKKILAKPNYFLSFVLLYFLKGTAVLTGIIIYLLRRIIFFGPSKS